MFYYILLYYIMLYFSLWLAHVRSLSTVFAARNHVFLPPYASQKVKFSLHFVTEAAGARNWDRPGFFMLNLFWPPPVRMMMSNCGPPSGLRAPKAHRIHPPEIHRESRECCYRNLMQHNLVSCNAI